MLKNILLKGDFSIARKNKPYSTTFKLEILENRSLFIQSEFPVTSRLVVPHLL